MLAPRERINTCCQSTDRQLCRFDWLHDSAPLPTGRGKGQCQLNFSANQSESADGITTAHRAPAW